MHHESTKEWKHEKGKDSKNFVLLKFRGFVINFKCFTINRKIWPFIIKVGDIDGKEKEKTIRQA